MKWNEKQKEDVLIEILPIYINDPSQRSIIDGDVCVYNSIDEDGNFKHCFAGHLMPEELKQQGESLGCNTEGINGLISYCEERNINTEDLKNNKYFLGFCQNLHDNSVCWDENSITKNGVSRLMNLCLDYNLNIERVFNELNLELPKEQV